MQAWELRHRAAAKTRLEQRPMTEEPRRYASYAPRNFLIYSSPTSPIRPIRSIRVRIETSKGQEVYLCLSPCASTARGLLCFCLMAQIEVKKFKRFKRFKSVLSVQSVVEKKSRVKPYVLLLSNSPAETDFPVEPRILDCSSKKNREKFAE